MYEAQLAEERRRAESQQRIVRSFEEKTFSASSNRPFIGKKYGSQPKASVRSSEKRTLTLHTEKKTSNIDSANKTKIQQTIKSTEGGDNYKYYESKNILKKGRRLPITIHHRRGELGAYIDDIPESHHHHKSSSYDKLKTSQKISTNLNKTFSKVNVVKSVNSVNKAQPKPKPKPKPKSIESPKKPISTNKNQKSTIKQIKTTTTTKVTSSTSGVGKSKDTKSSGKKLGTSYSEYKKYEQKGKTGSTNTSSSKYKIKQNTDYKRGGTSKGGESSYQYTRSDEYRQGGPSYSNYDESYQYTQTDEYRYGNTMGNYSQYQYYDDNEFETIVCPVHGRQTIRRSQYYNNYY